MGGGDKQTLANAFYDCGNFVLINITIDPATWETLKNEQPAGGTGAGSAHFVGQRYQWHTATQVTISGYRSDGHQQPSSQLTFQKVGIRKKSFWGSFSTTKPSFVLDFFKYNREENASIEDQIGVSRLTLNNSIQDDSYFRQPVGYALLRKCGCPTFRCNLARVNINNSKDPQIYVNMEAFEKPFFKNDANGFSAGAQGNAYELTVGDDLTAAVVNKPGYVDFQGFSQFSNKQDVSLAAVLMDQNGISSMRQIVNMPEFERFMAMEALMREWDGYCNNRNNTFIYVDSPAVQNPTPSNLNIKFIMSGIDQTCQDNQSYQIYAGSGRLAQLAMSDATTKTELAAVFGQLGGILGTSPSTTLLQPVWSSLQANLKHFDLLTADLSASQESYLRQLPTSQQCATFIQQLKSA